MAVFANGQDGRPEAEPGRDEPQDEADVEREREQEVEQDHADRHRGEGRRALGTREAEDAVAEPQGDRDLRQVERDHERGQSDDTQWQDQ